MNRAALSSPTRRPLGGFTLTELLIVMGVIGVLSTLTLVSVRIIAKDARLSSATNTVMAALDNARALAMKRNKPALVAFYPYVEGRRSRVEVITAGWAGDGAVADVGNMPDGSTGWRVFDRFGVLSDVPARPLPRGIKIAGPAYAENEDGLWLVMTDLTRQPDEWPGRIVGVMYGPDGTTLLGNSATDSDFVWVDRNGNGVFERDRNLDGVIDPATEGLFFLAPPIDWFELSFPQTALDEVVINLVPFLAIFDDDEAREIYDTSTWNDPVARTVDLSAYINTRADRIHFNRYTGVAMR
ncbi:MAG: prepilin-type N-terminal cleavage/methylation domain-containing protein [Planctomycetota bacterium]|jgi:prepilin-type N-terminal cleavage/methylation domain-containing protein